MGDKVTAGGNQADTTNGAVDMEALQASFDKSQEVQMQITMMTAEHKSIMAALDAQKKAYADIKG